MESANLSKVEQLVLTADLLAPVLTRLGGPRAAIMSLAPRATGSTEGERTAGDLRIGTESDNMVACGDGIETDRLTLTWPQTVRVGAVAQTLRLVC